MIKTDRVVIVEGKYDKIKLASILDAVVIETDGFAIFNDKEKQKLIRRLDDGIEKKRFSLLKSPFFVFLWNIYNLSTYIIYILFYYTKNP